MHLRQRQVPEIAGDLFRRLAHIVQHGNAANRDARPGDARSAAVYPWMSRDETPDISRTCHRF
jgi:hypothetical protein